MMMEKEVGSIKKPKLVKVLGFDFGSQDLEMIQWLRKGDNVAEFIVGDVEAELYAQDGNSQLISIECAKPEYQTKALQKNPNDSQAIVSGFTAMFPLLVEVQSGDGQIWKLNIQHSYHASNMDTPENFALRLDFTIVGSSAS